MIRVTFSVDPGDGQGAIECKVDYPSLSLGIPVVGVALRNALQKAIKPDTMRGAILRMLAVEVGVALGTRFSRPPTPRDV